MTEATARTVLLAYAAEYGLDPGLIDPALVEAKFVQVTQRAANAVARAVGDVPMRTVRAQWSLGKEETPGFPAFSFTCTVEIATGAELAPRAFATVVAYWNDEGYTTWSDGEARAFASPGKGDWRILAAMESDALFVTVTSGYMPTTTNPLASKEAR